MLLEVVGHAVEIVADGPAALEAVSAGDFDAVLVDIVVFPPAGIPVVS
jgi:CheY-like chemotaxis protein